MRIASLTFQNGSKVKQYCNALLSHLWKVILPFFLLLLPFTVTYAQPNTAESLELKVITLEQQFDAQVLNVLSNYFDSRKFFVDINIDARFVDETFQTTQNQIIKGGRTQQENVIMPGLPFLPEENRRTAEVQSNDQETTQTIINEQTIQRLQILKLSVNVYADSSISRQQDRVEFMRLIAGIAAKINEVRGDEVNITLINMPDFGIESLPPVRIEEPADARETLLGSVKDYIPGFVLLLLVGLTLLIGRLTHSPSRKQPKKDHKAGLSRDDLKHEMHVPRERIPGSKQPSAEDFIDDHKASVTNSNAGTTFVTDQFLNHPKEVALLFEFWMENDLKKGAEKASNIIQTVDRHLIKALKRELKPAYFETIQAQLNSTEPLSPEATKPAIAEFADALNNKLGSGSAKAKHQQLGLFQFLDHLKDYHIVQLLHGEDRITSALLIDYLPESEAAQVLNKIGKDRTVDIMLGIAQLHTLSYKEHKEISSRLFSKAMDILEVEKELKQGTENILRIIQQMPLEDQANYIEQLKASGSPVAGIIEEQFITIDQIPHLSHSLIKRAIAHIPTELLLEAVYSFDNEIADKLLSVRPKREQHLIRMELQQMNYSDKGEQAKHMVIDAIRKALN
ncbi:FliG C-terminal domain-containing protein [Gracilimonas tropica]|uniref:FliG C-terminal domain-containing protein n=1 Tax=Gracilimonas tropica TaxID=454600 RepID=UPI00037D7638|nr:FliG C-terminal domain-containing protein [Gracilimonas tropica]